MKEEIGMKLLFLAQEKKIFPKELLEEVEHFSGLLRKVRYGNKPVKTEEVFDEDYGDEEDYYYAEEKSSGESLEKLQIVILWIGGGFSLFDVAVKKTQKDKKKYNKKGKGSKWNKDEVDCQA